MTNLDFEQQRTFLKTLSVSMSHEELTAFILSSGQQMGMEKFKAQAAHEIVRTTNPCEAIPDAYSDFREIVHDGIEFFLSNFSSCRLAELAADQVLMAEDASVEERLVELARQIPTLHKLGQIIARNRNVDPSFRSWLIHLENDLQGSDIAAVRKKIDKEISAHAEAFSIRTEDEILAEASVGAVVAFTWLKSDTGKRAKGVFKILKPGITEHLGEELHILDKLAIFFDENRHRYSLRNFRFVETFKDIKDALEEEVDLLGEQAHLKKAFHFYGKEKSARIPRVLPFSTENMTAMEFMNGGKITDFHIRPCDRKMCAQVLFKTVIGHPLFSREKQTLFHGDPHAGNIYAFEGESGEVNVALLDWSQAGYLSKEQRINTLKLTTGIIIKDEGVICEAIEKLSEEGLKGNPLFLKEMRKIVHDIIISREYAECSLIRRTFFLIDQGALRGIRFPRNLLLFRKTFFTLEGVLYDLDPAFDMDVYMLRLVGTLLMEELPKRWVYLLFPFSDRPGHYKSLLSNNDLHLLGLCLFIESFKKGADILSVLTEKNAEFLSRVFCLAR